MMEISRISEVIGYILPELPRIPYLKSEKDQHKSLNPNFIQTFHLSEI